MPSTTPTATHDKRKRDAMDQDSEATSPPAKQTTGKKLAIETMQKLTDRSD